MGDKRDLTVGRREDKIGTDRSGKIQRALIFLLLFLIFAESTLLSSRHNRDLFHDSVESMTMDMAAMLTKLLPERREEYDRSEPQGRVLTKEMLPHDCQAWILDESGLVLEQSDDDVDIPEEVKNNLIPEEAKDSRDGCVIWSGDSNPLLLTQDCYVLSPISNSELYLLMRNGATAIKAKQRSQFTLSVGVNLILLIIAIVVINNMIVRFRRQIMQMATTDELTKLSNRKFFHRQYEEYIRDPQRAASSLFLLDVDRFKEINDTLGHLAGDKALSGLAQMIREMCSENGGFAGRWGGDEFVGVLPMPAGRAGAVLEKLCRKVVQAETERGFPMSVSVGVTPIAGNLDLAKITEKADEALYSSKENGRNQISVYRGEDISAKEKTTASGTITIDSLSSPESGAEGIIHTQIKNEGALSQENPPRRESLWKDLNFHTVRKKLAASIVLGVKWMTPFVAGGGILIALAFLFDAAAVDIASLPIEERANFGSITSIAASLKQLGDTTFNFMLPVFAGFMAFGLAGENAFMAGFVGGFMTIVCKTGFAGAMIAGLAAGLITSQLNLFTRHLPGLVRKVAPIVIFPVLNLIVLQVLTTYVISPISLVIEAAFTGILDRASAYAPSVGGGLAAMMMSVDMGGIINKVAYQYGLDAIAANRTDIMAAVMIGGMVPPIGIALSMLIFPGKYTRVERDSAPVTMVMGLSFITEGALPYVFTDFVRVIPSCMAGSFVAGTLSVLYGCKLPAPHGGMFVIPVIEHSLMFVLALAAGSLLAALLLGFLKKDKTEEL